MREPYGYCTDEGYKGWVDRLQKYILFESEGAYLEYISEEDDDD